jgi:tetratricopeptide (TPR) repeat protein
MLKTNVIVAVVLIAPAMGLMPLEQQIHTERNRLKYGSAKAALSLRDRVTQNMAIALLAGFRGIAADFTWIQSHGYWEKKQWLRQYRDMETVVMLQPQSVLFWDVGAWHMAWNIGYAVRVDTNNVTRAQGLKRERIWQERAAEFLVRGIENIPNRYDLYFKLGWVYYEKFKDDCKAGEYFGRAAQFPDAPTYVGRLYARALEKCGRPLEAYEYWKSLWLYDRNNPRQLWSVVEREIRRLEKHLNTPNDQRVFPMPGSASKNVS